MIIGYDPECLSLGTGVWDFFLTDIVAVPGTALLLSFPGTANHGPYSFSIYQACQPLEVAGTTNLRGGLGICIFFLTCWISARCRAKPSGVYIQPSRPVTRRARALLQSSLTGSPCRTMGEATVSPKACVQSNFLYLSPLCDRPFRF